MTFQNKQIAEVADKLTKRLKTLDEKSSVLRAVELKALYAQIPSLEPKQRASFGKEINQLKSYLLMMACQYPHRDRVLFSCLPSTKTKPIKGNKLT